MSYPLIQFLFMLLRASGRSIERANVKNTPIRKPIIIYPHFERISGAYPYCNTWYIVAPTTEIEIIPSIAIPLATTHNARLEFDISVSYTM